MRSARVSFSLLVFVGSLLMVALASIHVSFRMQDGKGTGVSAITVAIYGFVAVMLMLLSLGIGRREKNVAQSQGAAVQSTLHRAGSVKTGVVIWAARLGTICLLIDLFVQGVLRPAFPQYRCLSPAGSVALSLTITGMALLTFAAIAHAIRLVVRKRRI
jgi:hypothetical protein